MNDEILNVALKNTLAEIKKAYTDLNWSFILTSNRTVITADDDTNNDGMSKVADAFQSLTERAAAVGGLESMLIDGEKGKVYVSSVEDMHLVAGLAKHADLVYFRTVAGTVLPTIIKVIDSVASSTLTPTSLKPTPFDPYSLARPEPAKPIYSEPETEEDYMAQEEEKVVEEKAKELDAGEPGEAEGLESQKPEEVPSQQLIVDKFGGFLVKSDTVQLDSEVLSRWSALLDVKEIDNVEIETFGGKAIQCKVKVISDSKLEGRGLIRIPEKTCESLELRRGELVRVKPVVNENQESD